MSEKQWSFQPTVSQKKRLLERLKVRQKEDASVTLSDVIREAIGHEREKKKKPSSSSKRQPPRSP
jgi:hypothetical protein